MADALHSAGAPQDGRPRSALASRPAVAAALAAAFALACASGIAGLADTDPYRHLAYAAALWRSGFALRGWPMLPFTLLGDTGVDLWWGFHLLMVPFSALGTLWGARLAGACIAAAMAGTLAWLLRRLGQPRAAWFALAPLAFSYYCAYRAQLARPSQLTVPLVLACLAAGAGALGPAFALGAAFVHALLHLSAPLSPFFALLGLAGARLGGGRGSPRAVLWSVGGLAAGFLARPDRALYLPVAFLHNFSVLAEHSSAIGTGAEALPLPWRSLVFELWAGAALLAAALVLGRRARASGGGPAGDRPVRAAALLAAAVAAALALRTARFLDYAPALIAFAAGLCWPAGSPGLPAPKRERAVALAALLVLGGLSVRNLRLAWEEGSFLGPPALYERLADAVRARVPEGALLLTDDLYKTAPIYASLPEYRYVLMADPSLLASASPLLYFRWYHAVHDGNFCDAPRCSGAAPSPSGLARAVATFGTEWVVTSVPARASPAVRAMLRAPALFEPLWAGQQDDAGFVLWRVKRLAVPAATAR